PVAALVGSLVVILAAAAARWARIRDGWLVSSIAADPRAFIAVATALLAAAALVIYRAHPPSMDEDAPIFQARIFARGALFGQAPPEVLGRLIPNFRWFIEAAPDGRMISAYWPGFALLLTPFVWLDAPWLLNPLIGGATLYVLWRIAKRLWPEGDA